MDYDIDKNELSNTSGRKGRHLMNATASGKNNGGGGGLGGGGGTGMRDAEIQKSMDGKNI